MENLPQKVRSKKLSTRVDLTAMVSVSFLLIIFFMVTIELRKQKIMDLSLYTGLLQVPIVAPKETIYGENGIRKVLHARNKTMLEYSAALGRPGRGITVIIKPSKKCNYKNLVDILDEMAIAKIDAYAIVNVFTPEESDLLAAKQFN